MTADHYRDDVDRWREDKEFWRVEQRELDEYREDAERDRIMRGGDYEDEHE